MIKFILPLIAIFIATSSLVEAKENVKYQLSTHILDISSGKPALFCQEKYGFNLSLCGNCFPD